MALKSSREGLRKEIVDYLGNLIIDDNLKNEIMKVVGDNFATSENLNEAVNNLTMQITTESGERIEADSTLQNNITAETTAREVADTTLQNNINAETTARQEAITNLEGMIGTSGLQMDLLWENSSPTSVFEPQTINLDLNGYKQILIEFKAVSSSGIYNDIPTQIFTFENVPQQSLRISMNHVGFAYRVINILTNGITFSNGEYLENYNTGTLKTDSNSIVPLKIWGVK